MRKHPIVITSVVVFCVAFVASGASLDVNASAALEGSFGLEVIMNDTTSAFVLDDSPVDETVYRAEFLLDWNDLTFASSSGPTANHAVFKLWDMDQPGPMPRQFVVIMLRLGADGNNKVAAKIINFDGATSTPTWRNESAAPMELNLPPTAAGYPVRVRVEFQQGTTAAPADGVLTLSRATNFAPTTFAERTHSEVQNHLLNVDRIQLGGAGAMDATSTGSYYLDSFESYRTLAP